MFQTRLLDRYVDTVAIELQKQEKIYTYRSGGRDTPWLALLKRYLAHRILTQPSPDPQCPDSLFRRAAEGLCRLFGGGADEEEMHRHMATICQVGFWETFCCYFQDAPEGPGPAFEIASFAYSKPNRYACYEGDGPLRELLLCAAVYLGRVDLAKQIYAMDSKSPPLLNESLSAQELDPVAENRNVLAAAHGGLDMFRLVNLMDFGLRTKAQYHDEYSQDSIMDLIVNVSASGGDVRLINFLLDVGTPWNPNRVTYWTMYTLRWALLCAQTPDAFEDLAVLELPEIRPLSTHHREDKAVSRPSLMAQRLTHHAAANNPVMVRYLIDQGGAPFLNGSDPTTLPALLQERGKAGWPSGGWKAMQRPLLEAVEAGNMDTVKLMLESGADPNRHRLGLTPLAAAVRRGNLRMAQLLLQTGRADPSRGTPPPIVLAVKTENIAMMDLLLDNGALLHTPETGGWAMAMAEAYGLESMRDFLLGHGVEREMVWHHVYSLEEAILGGKFFNLKVTTRSGSSIPCIVAPAPLVIHPGD